LRKEVQVRGKYTVSEVEERTGVPGGSLRQWERRYGFPNPERSPSGYRYYSESDLAAIIRMRDSVAEGIPPSRAAVMAQEERRVAAGARPALELAEELAAALIRLEAESAERILSQANSLHPLDVVLLEVIRPALVRIGDLWHAGSIGVATEHFASNFVQGRLRGLLAMLPDQPRGHRVVVACGPGEHHEMGALILAIMLRRAGFQVIYLGADTPLTDLVDLAHEQEAEAVLLSISTRGPAARLRAERSLLGPLRALLVVGGAPLVTDPALAAAVGGVFLGNDVHKIASELASLLTRGRGGPAAVARTTEAG